MEEWALNMTWRTPPLLRAHPPANSALHTKKRYSIRSDIYCAVRKRGIPTLGAIIVELCWYPGDDRYHDAADISPTMDEVLNSLVLMKAVKNRDADRVLSSSIKVVKRRDDPHRSRTPRFILMIKDASALAPIEGTI